MTDGTASRSRWEIRGTLVCTLCARTVGTIHGLLARPMTVTSIQVPDASHADAVRRLQCPHCSGRLWLQDREEVQVSRHVLTYEDLHPRRGRPPRVSRVS
jgi:hypothetical protein